jgi:pterin-4a-carbinolamine dehydratase
LNAGRLGLGKRVMATEPAPTPDFAEQHEIDAAVERGWKPRAGALIRELQFRDFDEALGFVQVLADEAVDYLRRPDVCIASGHVVLTVENRHHAGFTKAEMRLVEKATAVIERHHVE